MTHTTYISAATWLWLRTVAIAITSLAAVGISSYASANGNSVTVEVEVIAANDSGQGVDSALRSYAGRLQSQFGQFDTFSQVTSASFTLNKGEDHSVSIPHVGNATLTLVSSNNGRHKLNVTIPGGGATVETSSGGFFFVGGPRAPNGTIILMIKTR